MNKRVKRKANNQGGGHRRIISILASRGFFYFVLAIFVLQALWIAFSFRFPLLYDEAYHFNLIKLYSHGLSPIINNQPASLDIYGDVVHHGSTLFHYLLSFPYRVVAHFTGSLGWKAALGIQVVLLRTICIILFGLGLAIFAKTFKRAGIKQVFINISMLFFVLLPIVPYVAANINYDNMLFPLTGLFLLIGVDIMKRPKPDWVLYLSFLLVGGVALLVKLEFIPIYAIGIIYISVTEWRRRGRSILGDIASSFRRSGKLTVGGLAIATVAVAVLLTQVYVRNLASYHTLLPSCQQLLNEKRCSSAVFAGRDNYLKNTKNQRVKASFPVASSQWLEQIESSTGLTGVNKQINGLGTVYAPSLPINYIFVFIFSIVGTGSLLFAWRALGFKKEVTFFVSMFAFYTLAVFVFNMHSYYKYYVFTAVQPRYLLQLLPILFVLIAAAFGYILQRRTHLKLVLLALVFVIYLSGAGVVNHIARSDDSWYWPTGRVIKVDHKLKELIDPIVIKGTI